MRGALPIGLILALATIAATGAATVLGVPGQAGEIESSRIREIEALLETTRQASAICTSTPTQAGTPIQMKPLRRKP
jgi:hypothetical protein